MRLLKSLNQSGLNRTITQRMALGTYRLQDPSGKQLQALVHGNRLLKAHINSRETLRKL